MRHMPLDCRRAESTNIAMSLMENTVCVENVTDISSLLLRCCIGAWFRQAHTQCAQAWIYWFSPPHGEHICMYVREHLNALNERRLYGFYPQTWANTHTGKYIELLSFAALSFSCMIPEHARSFPRCCRYMCAHIDFPQHRRRTGAEIVNTQHSSAILIVNVRECGTLLSNCTCSCVLTSWCFLCPLSARKKTS